MHRKKRANVENLNRIHDKLVREQGDVVWYVSNELKEKDAKVQELSTRHAELLVRTCGLQRKRVWTAFHPPCFHCITFLSLCSFASSDLLVRCFGSVPTVCLFFLHAFLPHLEAEAVSA